MSATTELQTWLNGTPTGGPNGDGRYPLTAKDGTVFLVYCPAAQALNPALAEQPVEIFSEQAQAAATNSAASASTAEAARIAAAGSAASAAASATSATTSATAASTSAGAALASQNAASSSASAAGTSETNAAASAAAAAASASSINLGNYVSIAGAESITGAKTFTADTLVSRSNAIIGIGISDTRNGGVANYAAAGTGDIGLFSEHAGGRIRLRPDGRLSTVGSFEVTTSGFAWGGNTGWHAGNLLNIGTTAASARTALQIASFGGTLSALSISPRNFSVVDNSIVTGLYRYSESDGDTGGPIASDRGAILHTRRSTGGGETQNYWSENGTRAFFRRRVTGAWSAWNEYGLLGSTQTWTAVQTFAASNPIRIDGAAGAARRIQYRTSGVDRWQVGVDGTAESGSNAGSLFVVNRYDDAGASLGSAVSIDRATGTSTLQALTVSGAVTLGGAFVVGTGGYLINRRVIPRVYLESPNQTNGYILDANVSDAVFGSFRILRRDTSAVIFDLNNAAQLTGLATLTTTGAITAGGIVTGRTQTRAQNADNSHSLRMEVGSDNSKNLLAAGGVAPFYIGNQFGVTDQPVYLYNNNAVRVTLTAAGALDFAAGGRVAFRPDATAALSGDLPIHAVANLSVNYHNNNLLGVHATGVYLTTDNQFCWHYKAGTTWRTAATLVPSPSAAGASLQVDGTVHDAYGHVRMIPVNVQNANYTFALADIGRAIVKTDTTARTYTIPNNSSVVLPIGTSITLRNKSATANITVARASGVTLRRAGSGTDAQATIAPWGLATLHKEDTNEWVISGTGVS